VSAPLHLHAAVYCKTLIFLHASNFHDFASSIKSRN